MNALSNLSTIVLHEFAVYIWIYQVILYIMYMFLFIDVFAGQIGRMIPSGQKLAVKSKVSSKQVQVRMFMHMFSSGIFWKAVCIHFDLHQEVMFLGVLVCLFCFFFYVHDNSQNNEQIFPKFFFCRYGLTKERFRSSGYKNNTEFFKGTIFNVFFQWLRLSSWH